jgi:Spy/CpxP family protein refolding chaperone
MTRTKRNTLIAASAAVALAVAGISYAHSGPENGKSGGGWGQHMMGQMRGMGSHMIRGMHGRFGRSGARPMISLALRFQEDLKLTQDQIKKLTGLRDDFTRRSIGERAAVRTMRFDLRKALEADKVDLGASEKQIRAIAAKRADRRIDRLRTIEKGKAVLTKEQRTALGGLIRQNSSGWMSHQGYGRGGYGNHGGGPGMMGPGGGPGRMGPGGGPGKMVPGQGQKRF